MVPFQFIYSVLLLVSQQNGRLIGVQAKSMEVKPNGLTVEGTPEDLMRMEAKKHNGRLSVEVTPHGHTSLTRMEAKHGEYNNAVRDGDTQTGNQNQRGLDQPVPYFFFRRRRSVVISRRRHHPWQIVSPFNAACESCIKSKAPIGYTGSTCLDPDQADFSSCTNAKTGDCSNQDEVDELLFNSPCVCSDWKASQSCPGGQAPPCSFCGYSQSTCQDAFASFLQTGSLSEKRTRDDVDDSSTTIAKKPLLQRQHRSDDATAELARFDNSLTSKCG